MSNELLSTLGLCLKAGMLAVGEEPVEAVSRARDARLLMLASDAAENTARRVLRFAETGQCLWLRAPFTKAELGRATGRSSCAILAVTDVGFASAIAHRLADSDPAQYGETAKRLEVKAQRAALRKTEQALHEKNLRKGKKRVKPARPAAPAEKPVEQTADSTGPAPARKPYGKPGERKPYGKPGERKPFGKPGERKPYGKPGERKPYGKPGEGKPYGKPGERKPYGKPGERKPYGKPGEGKPYGKPGERKPFGKTSFPHSHPVKHGKGSFPKKDK